MSETERVLAALTHDVDAETELCLRGEWSKFLFGDIKFLVFSPNRVVFRKPCETFCAININDAVADLDLMVRSQLISAYAALHSPAAIPCVRANYSTGIMSRLFGAELFMMPRHTNTLPTTRTMAIDCMSELLDRGIPDQTLGWGAEVFAAGELFAEYLSRSQITERFVYIYHPDLQGPLDVAELLFGGELIYAMYDNPELVKAFLALVTDTYIKFLDSWYKLCPPDSDMNVHWGSFFHRGKTVLRDDSAMNLSPELYKEFAFPFDCRLFEYYGGAVHFCGRGDHYIEILSGAKSLYGINLSQPEYNDMEKIYTWTVDRGIPILGFPSSHKPPEGRIKSGFHTLG